MKNINCPKCGKELINLNLNLNHTKTGAFWCCGMKIEIFDGPDVVISNDKLKVCLNNLNEGMCGDYNPENPNDVNLLRFSVYEYVDDLWIDVEDASCCTSIRADSAIDELVEFAYTIFKEFSNVDLTSREEVSMATTKMSWLGIQDPEYFDYKDEKLYFGYSRYHFGDGVAISAFTDENEPWCMMTVNLPDKPPLGENEVYIPLYNVKEEYEKIFKPNFVASELGFVKIGYGEGVHVKLVDNYKDKMVDMSC